MGFDIRREWQRYAGMVLFFILWEIVGRTGIATEIFPAFSTTMVRLVELWMDGTFPRHTFDTLFRVGLSLLIGGVLAVVSGIWIGWSGWARRFFDVLVDYFRNLSVIVLIPISILFLGVGFLQKIVIITKAVYFDVLLTTIGGVANAESERVDAARTMGASQRQILRHIIFPSALPAIHTGFKLAISSAFIAVIAAEVIGARSGLGYYLANSQQTFRTVDVFATAFLITTIAYLANKLIDLIGNHLLRWKKHTVNVI